MSQNPEQQLEAELERQTSLLRRQIDTAPLFNRGATRAREWLERAADLYPDPAARLEAVRRERLELSEAVRYGTPTRVFAE